MTFWKLTLREIKRRPFRALLTLLSVVLGVAAVVSVNMAVDASRRAYKEMYETVAGRAALEVVARGGDLFDPGLAADLDEAPGVAAAASSLQRLTVMFRGDTTFTLQGLGIDPARDLAVRDYKLDEGRFLEGKDEVLLESGFARGAGIGVGDEVRLRAWTGLKNVKVVGLLAPRGPAGFSVVGTVFLPLPTAQRYFGARGKIDTISLVLDDSADPAAVTREVARRLPPGLLVRTPASRTRLTRESLLSAEVGLTFGSALILVLGAFIILNTFMMNVGERRQQLAVLRTIGATRRQIICMLLAEGLVLGLLGTLIGAFVGLGGTRMLAKAMAEITRAPSPDIYWTPTPFLLAATIGPLISVLAAVYPAWVAGSISPLEGLRPAVTGDHARLPLAAVLSGAALLVAAILMLLAAETGRLPIALSIWSGVAVMPAVVLMIPCLLRPLARGAAWLAAPLLGGEVYLAHRQLLRRAARTTLTVGVLCIAVATGIGMGTAILNNVEDVRGWYRRITDGDFVVRAVDRAGSADLAVAMPLELGDQIRAIQGVTEVESIRFVSARVSEQPMLVIAREFQAIRPLPLQLAEGDSGRLRQQLAEGQVVVGTSLAQRCGLKVGGDLVLETAQGPHTLRIAGTAVEYNAGGLVVYADREVAGRLLGFEGADAFLIRAAPDSVNAVEKTLLAFCRQQGLMAHTRGEMTRSADELLANVVRGLWGVLALGFIVAAFGTANTLSMNVLEQVREIAMLRVVAMTRRQVRKMIIAEALIILGIGLLLGTLLGLGMAWWISRLTLPLVGYSIAFSLHPLLLVSVATVALAVVLLAALLPAERAARLNLLIALQYE